MKGLFIALAISTGVAAALWVFALLFTRYPGWVTGVIIIPAVVCFAGFGFLAGFLRYRGIVKKMWPHSPLTGLLLGIAASAFAIEIGLRVYSSDSQWAMLINTSGMIIIFVGGRLEQRAHQRVEERT